MTPPTILILLAGNPLTMPVSLVTWLTLEGEQKLKFSQSSGLGFQPLNHNKQKCVKCFPLQQPCRG